MITKDEFKNLYAHKRIKIGSWSMVCMMILKTMNKNVGMILNLNYAIIQDLKF